LATGLQKGEGLRWELLVIR